MSCIYPENALLLAPLSGFSDLPYRRAARRCGNVFAFTEMVDAASLAYASERSSALLLRGEEEDFLGVQLVGADPELIKRACEVLNRYDFSVLDLNIGCPVPKVVKKGAGAELGRHLEQALNCFQVLKGYAKFPLTAKLRIVDREDVAPTLALCRGLAELGAQALTIHGRVREQFYSGPVAFDQIRQVREALPEIPVIANGGVHSVATYEEMRRETGCSRVMLATGAMGNPWLFQELTDPAHFTPPDCAQWRAMVEEHVNGMVELYGEAPAMRHARKILHDYLKGRGFPGTMRAAASGVSNWAEFRHFLDQATEWRKNNFKPLLNRQ